jgi:REP element-mobilizing transposase RayT
MIVGYHLIFATYGFWLPNDPRGSWSEFVGSWDLLCYGPATKTTARHSVAARQHDTQQRLAAKQALKYPPVEFTGLQAREVGRAFAGYVERSQLPVWACAIMPDHVHLVVGKPRIQIEQLAIQLKGEATEQLLRAGLHPLARFQANEKRPPKCWSRGQWKVYLDPDDVLRAIEYVNNNPIKAGLPRQTYPFITPPPNVFT